MAATTGRAKDNLKLRKEPSLDAEYFDIVRIGQQVQILKTEGDWMLVRVDGHDGYVISKFVVAGK
jgi:uncharacterized protein YgiM (DUF1202 family)